MLLWKHGIGFCYTNIQKGVYTFMSAANKKAKEVTESTCKDNKETEKVNSEDTYKDNFQADGTKEPVQAKESVVYIGPDLKNIVSRNTIFKNGIPEEITREAGSLPVIMKLFVPLKKLPEALKTFTQGGFYKTLYGNAVKEIAKINSKGGESHE